MDTRDKQFDNWIKNNLNTEIALNKQHRQLAWQQIQLNAVPATIDFDLEEDFNYITSPIVVQEPLHIRIRQWVAYVFTQEHSYQRAHDHSAHYYKAKPHYYSGLSLHEFELMRHRWACPV